LEKPEFEKENDSFNLSTLNDSQNAAIRKILAAKDIAIVHGLPVQEKLPLLYRLFVKH